MRKSTDIQYVVQFGERLREVRKSKKITMEKLAELSDMEYSQISRIEKGNINTSISTVKILADALDVKVMELFDF